jgi:hypothetical protein
MCHDNPYKSSRYWNPTAILVDVLMTMKRLGVPYLYALTKPYKKLLELLLPQKKISNLPRWKLELYRNYMFVILKIGIEILIL